MDAVSGSESQAVDVVSLKGKQGFSTRTRLQYTETAASNTHYQAVLWLPFTLLQVAQGSAQLLSETPTGGGTYICLVMLTVTSTCTKKGQLQQQQVYLKVYINQGAGTHLMAQMHGGVGKEQGDL